eukprot:6207413-Pleurochrysis_carterae.AAC.1
MRARGGVRECECVRACVRACVRTSWCAHVCEDAPRAPSSSACARTGEAAAASRCVDQRRRTRHTLRVEMARAAAAAMSMPNARGPRCFVPSRA